MVKVGKWQLEKVMKNFQEWQSHGVKIDKLFMEMPISLFENELFLNEIPEIFARYEVDKTRIVFDIVESTVKSNNLLLRKALEKINNMGVKVSLSILAMGRMALHNDAEFSIDYLKIDAQLVKGLLMHLDNEAIIVSLIAIANNKNIMVMADSVDLENQKTKLIELGCSVMKGRIFCDPVSGAELLAARKTKLATEDAGSA